MDFGGREAAISYGHGESLEIAPSKTRSASLKLDSVAHRRAHARGAHNDNNGVRRCTDGQH